MTMNDLTRKTILELYNKIKTRWAFKDLAAANLYLEDLFEVMGEYEPHPISKLWKNIIRREGRFRPQPSELINMIESPEMRNPAVEVYSDEEYAKRYNSNSFVPEWLSKGRYKLRCRLMESDAGQVALSEGFGNSLWLDSEKPEFDFNNINLQHYRNSHRRAKKIADNLAAHVPVEFCDVLEGLWRVMEKDNVELSRKFKAAVVDEMPF